MKSRKQTKEVTLKLNYYKSQIDKEAGIYLGGVAEPEYIDELEVNVCDDYEFDAESEEFKKNGLYAVEISGSNRALKELGKLLINIAMFKTQDEDYHEHLETVKNNKGQPAVNITIRKKTTK